MPEKTEAAPVETTWENPLIPNKRLRRLYTSMVELRLLQARLARGKKPLGDEAIRVSTLLSLLPADLTSEPVPNPGTAFLRGANLSALAAKSELPPIKDPAARLYIAIGAALARASKKNSPLVLAYIHPSDLTLAAWKPILRLASVHAAPILFVTLPQPSRTAKNPGQLSLAATRYGVPGIPVDAADAVALYRVAQESILRIRAGGGPVLMECIPFRLPGTKTPPSDPILNMRESLLRRKLADEIWLAAIPKRFAARLKAAVL